MKRSYCLAAPLILSAVLSLTATAQRAGVQPPTVLFVCEHGTVRSLLAKVLFEEYAGVVGLRMNAVSRGTHADSIVPPWMVQGLSADHIALGPWTPQTLRPKDLADAAYVVSFDVPLSATNGARVRREQWDSLPSVSKNYTSGRDAIKVRVHALVDSLKRTGKLAKRRDPAADLQ